MRNWKGEEKMQNSKTNSVGYNAGLWGLLTENLAFFRMRLRGLKGKGSEIDKLLVELDQYGFLYRSLSGKELQDARIFELGYGARPLRLILLISMGYDAHGIDLDRPTLTGSIKELINIYQSNGILRCIKSFVRMSLFDAHERRALDRALRKKGKSLKIEPNRFLVGDIANCDIDPGSIDCFYSEDVFEHIPREAMARVCEGIARAMSEDALAFISPSIYTGICGSHLVEWYPHTLTENIKRHSEPWEHLRKKRYQADCFLNKMRIQEFESVFEAHFDVIEVQNINAGRGHLFLAPSIRSELAEYSEDELLSDKWRFVLRKKRGPGLRGTELFAA